MTAMKHLDRPSWDVPASTLAGWFSMETPKVRDVNGMFPVLASRWMRIEEEMVGGDLIIRAELPGIDPDKDVELEVSDGMLHMTATRREESVDNGKRRSEFRYGRFSRCIHLPRGASANDVSATYEDGILMVRVPGGPVPAVERVTVTHT